MSDKSNVWVPTTHGPWAMGVWGRGVVVTPEILLRNSMTEIMSTYFIFLFI